MKIRKAIALVFAFALIAVACGDDDSGGRFSSEIRDPLIQECEAEQPAGFCECYISGIEKSFTQEEFIRFAIEGTEEIPEDFLAIGLTCLGEADLG